MCPFLGVFILYTVFSKCACIRSISTTHEGLDFSGPHPSHRIRAQGWGGRPSKAFLFFLSGHTSRLWKLSSLIRD